MPYYTHSMNTTNKPNILILILILTIICYSYSQQQQQCTTIYRIDNKFESIDICYHHHYSKKNPIEQEQQLYLYKLLTNQYIVKQQQKQWKCYRFFDKLSLLQTKKIKGESNNQNGIVQNGRIIINKVKQIIKKDEADLKWDGLLQFRVIICYSELLESYKLLAIQKFIQSNKVGRSMESVHLAQSIGSINKLLHGKGFHQQITYSLKLAQSAKTHDINSQQCSLIFDDILPQSTYIDIDQLHSFYLESTIKVTQLISVQLPTYLSKQFWYRYQIPLSSLTETNVNQYKIETKVHFRYPTPRNITKTKKSYKFDKQGQYQQIKLHPFSKVAIKCQRNNQEQYLLIKEDYMSNRGQAWIPVGDISDSKLVTSLTIAAQVICAILLVRKIKK